MRQATFGLTLLRWFCKSFYEMETPDKPDAVPRQELKKFMQKVNYKIPNAELKKKFWELEPKNMNDLYFDVFQDLVFSPTLFALTFARFSASGGSSLKDIGGGHARAPRHGAGTGRGAEHVADRSTPPSPATTSPSRGR